MRREKGGVLIAGNRSSKRKERANRRWNAGLIVLAVLATISLMAAVIVLTRPKADPQSTLAQEPVEKLTDGIDLPGYKQLTFRAGVTEQNVALQNLPQNFCYIQPSLWLADGTLLWRGQLIAPGDTGDAIILSFPLAAGEYPDAVLRYDCFAMDEEKSPLNGATTQLILNVQ